VPEEAEAVRLAFDLQMALFAPSFSQRALCRNVVMVAEEECRSVARTKRMAVFPSLFSAPSAHATA
jgi:hypothetical protein